MKSADVVVPPAFARFISRTFPDDGQSWIEALPELVSRYAQIWRLEVQPPFENLSYNYVAPVFLQDGTRAVLKVGTPDVEQRSEIHALRAFAGRGVARLIASNATDRVSLIEHLAPGTMLSTLFPQSDETATTIGASVMKTVARPAPSDHSSFISLSSWFEAGLSQLRAAYNGRTGPFPTRLVEQAETLYRDLGKTTESLALIHGDLHHMNILYSSAHEHWLAIDPKGVIGDRAYEPAPFILNPNYALADAPNLSALLTRRIDLFSEQLEIDRYRILGWATTFSVLSAWWSFESGGSWRETIALGEALAKLG